MQTATQGSGELGLRLENQLCPRLASRFNAGVLCRFFDSTIGYAHESLETLTAIVRYVEERSGGQRTWVKRHCSSVN
jgi:hypothetical protein